MVAFFIATPSMKKRFLFINTLFLLEKKYGQDHPDTATSYNNIGDVHICLGEYDKALKFHYKALTIREKTIGLEHPSTAGS